MTFLNSSCTWNCMTSSVISQSTVRPKLKQFPNYQRSSLIAAISLRSSIISCSQLIFSTSSSLTETYCHTAWEPLCLLCLINVFYFQLFNNVISAQISYIYKILNLIKWMEKRVLDLIYHLFLVGHNGHLDISYCDSVHWI